MFEYLLKKFFSWINIDESNPKPRPLAGELPQETMKEELEEIQKRLDENKKG